MKHDQTLWKLLRPVLYLDACAIPQGRPSFAHMMLEQRICSPTAPGMYTLLEDSYHSYVLTCLTCTTEDR